jgi:hypothetical protein
MNNKMLNRMSRMPQQGTIQSQIFFEPVGVCVSRAMISGVGVFESMPFPSGDPVRVAVCVSFNNVEIVAVVISVGLAEGVAVKKYPL